MFSKPRTLIAANLNGVTVTCDEETTGIHGHILMKIEVSLEDMFIATWKDNIFRVVCLGYLPENMLDIL